MDINDPRNPNNVNRPGDFPASPATREGTLGFMWPIIAVIAPSMPECCSLAPRGQTSPPLRLARTLSLRQPRIGHRVIPRHRDSVGATEPSSGALFL